MSSQVDLLVSAIFHGADTYLRGRMLPSQCIDFRLSVLQLLLQMITLLPHIDDLGGEAINQALAFGALELSSDQLVGTLGEIGLSFRESDAPQCAFLRVSFDLRTAGCVPR